ncbi:thymidylate synthase [Aeromonas phage phiA047]|nr:thymidylate synthase [Aeromonas phage phiA047]
MNPEKQYLKLCEQIIEFGEWVCNERTGKRCLTVPNATMYYSEDIPVLTTKQVAVNSAIAEITGYLRGYTDASEFDRIGTKTWYANANLTKAWLDNPNRKGENDMGKVYGATAKDFNGVNLIKKVMDDLISGKDDRGEIITFWNPADFDKGCLRPCLMQHHFTILNDKLYLTSYQRSCDVPLGLSFNMIQVWFLLKLMCHVTGFKFGGATHHIVNAHIYEDQLEILKEQQLVRKPLKIKQKFEFTDKIKTFDDILIDNLIAKDYYTLTGYEHQGKIVFPFSE